VTVQCGCVAKVNLKPILNRNVTPYGKKLFARMQTYAKELCDRLIPIYAKATKALTPEDEELLARLMEEVTNGPQLSEDVLADYRSQVVAIFSRAGVEGYEAVLGDETPVDITSQLDDKALEWAEQRSAELVVDVDDTTRNLLRGEISDAIENGWSPDELRNAIMGNQGFSDSRAMTIARTEMADAHIQGNLAGWGASGVVVGKRSVMSDLHDEPDVCNECADEGVIPLDQPFASGDDGPPYHPNCECDLIPVTGDDQETAGQDVLPDDGDDE
jgi:hypothetical protein